MTRFVPVIFEDGHEEYIIKPDGMSLELMLCSILQDEQFQTDACVKKIVDYYNRLRVIEEWDGHPDEYIYKFVLRDKVDHN
jgi:hypothetical protein